MSLFIMIALIRGLIFRTFAYIWFIFRKSGENVENQFRFLGNIHGAFKTRFLGKY